MGVVDGLVQVGGRGLRCLPLNDVLDFLVIEVGKVVFVIRAVGVVGRPVPRLLNRDAACRALVVELNILQAQRVELVHLVWHPAVVLGVVSLL